ncbi:MAG: D-sedoheptulose 7-phosphate isomerase [Candidatus Omnitrophota bacterium]
MRRVIEDAILESIRVKEGLIKANIGDILKIANEIISSIKKGGKLIIFGNGGSASDAQHIAAELVGRFKKDRPALPAIALTVNTSIITALANDFGYEAVFARQVEALAKKPDIVLGISTSGKAKNVSLGLKEAKKMGLYTIALTGCDGGEVKGDADISLIVPSYDTPRIQESHILIGHIICQLVEDSGVC